MNDKCPLCAEAAAYVSGELARSEQTVYEAHLTSCAACRTEVAGIRTLLQRLRATPELEPGAELAPLILARLRKSAPQPALLVRAPRFAAIAAVLALMAGGSFFMKARIAPKPVTAASLDRSASVARALDWFCQNQEQGGSWNAEKWGGSRHYEIALTALPTLALLSSDTISPQSSLAIDSATRWLQQQQTATGSFGPAFSGAAYNESIATLALLHAYRRQPAPALKRTLDAALANLLARQTPDGGWGYFNSPLSDRSITEWHLEALALYVELGWEHTRIPLDQGRAWLGAHPYPSVKAGTTGDSSDTFPPDETTSGSAGRKGMDFYRAYFLASALRQANDVTSRLRLAALRRTLLPLQAVDGSEAGSWPADDRWSRAGGRLYSTALASLALREN